jgi:uncharacterized phiE125 gp8 family phage protein
MLTELTPTPAEGLPRDSLADYLRLSQGFADDAALGAHLEACLRAAIAAIEARTAKALFRRSFALAVHAWTAPERQDLPVAPVVAVHSVRLISRGGTETPLPSEAWDLVSDSHRASIVATSGDLPPVASGGQGEIRFDAGYAADWAGMPADLAQAVILLAAGYFGQDADTESGVPAAVARLLEPFRALRLGRAGA